MNTVTLALPCIPRVRSLAGTADVGVCISIMLALPHAQYMVLTGSDQASIILTASASGTALRINYKCNLEDDLLFSLSISPLWLALWMGVWLLVITICCASTCWIFRHRRTNAPGGPLVQVAGPSILMRHAELLRRREQERREAREAEERATANALLALPTRAWQGILDAVGGGAAVTAAPATGEESSVDVESSQVESEEVLECCLCMDAFEKDEQIRLLPCNHYFHRDCIDRWFATRAYQQRSCPLCKRDPLERHCSHESSTASMGAMLVAESSGDPALAAMSVAREPPDNAAVQREAGLGRDADTDTDAGLELVELPDARDGEQGAQSIGERAEDA